MRQAHISVGLTVGGRLVQIRNDIVHGFDPDAQQRRKNARSCGDIEAAHIGAARIGESDLLQRALFIWALCSFSRPPK